LSIKLAGDTIKSNKGAPAYIAVGACLKGLHML